MTLFRKMSFDGLWVDVSDDYLLAMVNHVELVLILLILDFL